jgi:hypothetical protein
VRNSLHKLGLGIYVTAVIWLSALRHVRRSRAKRKAGVGAWWE